MLWNHQSACFSILDFWVIIPLAIDASPTYPFNVVWYREEWLISDLTGAVRRTKWSQLIDEISWLNWCLKNIMFCRQYKTNYDRNMLNSRLQAKNIAHTTAEMKDSSSSRSHLITTRTKSPSHVCVCLFGKPIYVLCCLLLS